MRGSNHVCSLAFRLALGSASIVAGPVVASQGDQATTKEQRQQPGAQATPEPARAILNLKPDSVIGRGAGHAQYGFGAVENAEALNASTIREALTILAKDVERSDACSKALQAAANDGQAAAETVAARRLPSAVPYGRELSLPQGGQLPKEAPRDVTEVPKERADDGEACTPAKLQDLLIKQRRAFRFLKKWTGRCRKDKECGSAREKEELRDQVDALQSALNELLEREGLREPFVADLVTGVAFGTPPENSDGDTSTLPGAFIRWRSNPFGFGYDTERDLDFTFGGRFGYMPALTLVEPAPEASEAAAGSETLEYQEAFGWDLRFNGRYHFGDHVQLVASAGGGQMILNSESSIGKLDGRDALFTVVPNGVGRAAFFWDGHVAFRYFKSNRDVRADQQSINPGLELSFGVRHDTRFKQDGALVAYDSPERRYLFRLLLSDLRVFDRRKPADSKEAPTFTVTFGVEHEFGARNGLPSVTRILLVGDLALLKALNGSRQ